MFIYIARVSQNTIKEKKMKIKKQLDKNDNNIYYEKNKRQKSTAPGIPRRSPIQVLTGLDVA